MMPRSRRSGGGSSGGGGGGTTRTHMLFSQQKELHVTKRKRKTHNRLQQHLHKKDEMIQTGPDELDPSLWTGNQRVLHYGPLAQRDPFFYYYPKGWDILYPAHFGFFPYRTSKFRGSSTVICIWAFGLFFIFGGGLMVYLGYFVLYKTPFWTWPPEQLEHFPPIQIAGPILFGFGGILVFLGMILSLFTSQFLNEKLRHYHHRDQPPQTVIYTTLTQQPRGIIEKHPYQPLPPPAYPVLENRYARSSMFNPQAEMKLYPPV
uniref:Uncharacterized protein n=1 Tax=Acrobeloides nanus TaxID=290746 RepID=A0A914DZ04_9BILA